MVLVFMSMILLVHVKSYDPSCPCKKVMVLVFMSMILLVHVKSYGACVHEYDPSRPCKKSYDPSCPCKKSYDPSCPCKKSYGPSCPCKKVMILLVHIKKSRCFAITPRGESNIEGRRRRSRRSSRCGSRRRCIGWIRTTRRKHRKKTWV